MTGMSYRDDLAAAHARIEALEAQLGHTGHEISRVGELVARTTALEAQLARLRAELAELGGAHERLQHAMRAAPGDMPTLYEANRSVPPGPNAMSGKPAGVRCPMCLMLLGESVQMRIGGNLRLVLSQEGTVGATDQTVRCPRCDYLGLKLG